MKYLPVVLFLLGAQVSSAQDIYNRATTSLTAGDTTAAFSRFQEAVKAGQKLTESNYYLGAISFSHRKIDDAINFLTASIKADDENVEAIKLLGQARLEKKQTKEAIAQFRLAAKLAPKDCSVFVFLGQALVAADSMDPAIIQLTRAKECMPDNPDIYISLGDAYFKIGVKPLAISNYEKALELAPKDTLVCLKVARAYSANKQYNEAVRAYAKAEEIDSNYSPAYLEHGSILVRAKLYKLAIPPLNRFVQLKPKHVEGAALYAEALYGGGYSKLAADAAQTALRLDSTNTDLLRIRAHSLAEIGEYQDALVSFKRIELRKAIKPEDYIMIGRADFGVHKDDEAMDAFQKAMAIDSSNCDIYFPLGSLLMKKQDYPKAIQMFEKKIDCDPRSLSAFINAGILYMQNCCQNLPRARELFLKAIDLKGDFLQARLWLARYYVQADSLKLGEDQYLEVIRLIGDQVDKNKAVYGEAQKLLGSLYMINKQYTRAIEAFRKVLSVGADDGNTHLSWGQAILQTLDPKDTEEENRRKNDDALKQFRICVQKDPGNVQGHFWLGECLIRSRIPGEDQKNEELRKEACAEWKTVLKLDPKNEDARKEMARIGC